MPLKVLVIRFSSIGDIVLTTPVIRCLKTQRSDIELHYVTKASYRFLIADNPYIDKIHVLEESLWGLIGKLRQEKFDVIIDLHNNLRTLQLKTALGVESYSFNKLNWEKWLFVNLKVKAMPSVHIVDRYLDAVRKLGVVNDDRGLDYFIPYKDIIEPDWLPITHQHGYVAYAIGGQHETKKLPLERMIELCQKISYPIVLLGGKEDADNGEAIERALGKERVYNACGKCNFNQSASLVQQSKLVFSHDTGLMHVAAAFKKKVYSIWGNTVPEFGMYPYQTNFVILENRQLDCRPCSKIGNKRCPKGHFKCMNELSFQFEIKELKPQQRP
ncbi:glycosyltransferase family 9 protein [Runella sp. SP2]|uniref:glycosyltransferase family 9 protein n=1 Tax=Runella sp. SP2 TaxID=2268026 RepID=UPI000F09724C|nr:glycosyltransferase family 9 protein [Runella sp. SP2]AYQ35016.1 glycosyltransferase family 9 protein [Runella sp. SP2]